MDRIPTFSTLSDTLNAFVRAAMEDGDGDDHAFWSFCSKELHRLQEAHGSQAANATGFETRMRHRAIANVCEALASSDGNDDMIADLRGAASIALERMRSAHGEGRAYLLAEFRLCILAADLEYEDFGLTRDVFLAYLEQCAQPA